MTTPNPKERALEIVSELRQARVVLSQATLALGLADGKLTLVKAQAESRVIESLGDEKALGSNQTARERSLALAIADDLDLQEAQADYKLAYFHKADTAAQVKALEEELKVLLAFATEF